MNAETMTEELPEIATIPQAGDLPEQEQEQEQWRIPPRGIDFTHDRHSGRADAVVHCKGYHVPRYNPDSVQDKHRAAVEATEEYQAYSKLLASYQAKVQELDDTQAEIDRLTKAQVSATVAGDSADKFTEQLPALRASADGLARLISGMLPHVQQAYLKADSQSRALAAKVARAELDASRQERQEIEDAIANSMGPILADWYANHRRYNAASALYAGKLPSPVPQPPAEAE